MALVKLVIGSSAYRMRPDQHWSVLRLQVSQDPYVIEAYSAHRLILRMPDKTDLLGHIQHSWQFTHTHTHSSYVQTYMQTYTHVCMHIHKHSNINTHTHTHTYEREAGDVKFLLSVGGTGFPLSCTSQSNGCWRPPTPHTHTHTHTQHITLGAI